jgi:tRNA threonylcarbamoyl adenosine modification protein YjeE
MKVTRYGEENVQRLVSENINNLVVPDTIFALSGPLGAGKTTIVQNVLASLGVLEPIVSPTFSYVNQYKLLNGDLVLHFDLYRVGSSVDFCSLGFSEMINKKGVCVFIEWPEVIANELDDLSKIKKIYKIDIDYDDENLKHRVISISEW